MEAANPYLNFNGNTEEAFEFYRSVFGGEFAMVLRYKDFPANAMGVAEGELDKIAHIALPLGKGNMLMGTDVIASRGGAPLWSSPVCWKSSSTNPSGSRKKTCS